LGFDGSDKVWGGRVGEDVRVFQDGGNLTRGHGGGGGVGHGGAEDIGGATGWAAAGCWGASRGRRCGRSLLAWALCARVKRL
jgi:hypothetical protein